MSFGVFVMVAPFPAVIYLANTHSDFLVITETPVMGVAFPVSVYLVVLTVAIWGCRSLNRSLIKSLFSDKAESVSSADCPCEEQKSSH
jgi:hypothetical protein